MQMDLEEEKRVSARRWAKRGKQITRVIERTGGMYGDLQGVLGSALPPIAAIESGDNEIIDALTNVGNGATPPLATADEP